MLSAHPIVETDFREFTEKGKWYKPWHGDWWAGKGVGLVRIRLPGGEFDLYATHAHSAYNRPAEPDEYRSVRLSQIRELLEFIDSTSRSGIPALAVGDFNCATGSEEYAVLLREGSLQTLLSVPTPYDHVFAKEAPDIVYTSAPTVLIETAAVDGEPPLRLSDHDGYVARITITRTSDAARREPQVDARDPASRRSPEGRQCVRPAQ